MIWPTIWKRKNFSSGTSSLIWVQFILLASQECQVYTDWLRTLTILVGLALASWLKYTFLTQNVQVELSGLPNHPVLPLLLIQISSYPYYNGSVWKGICYNISLSFERGQHAISSPGQD
jgi:hypothetical protein